MEKNKPSNLFVCANFCDKWSVALITLMANIINFGIITKLDLEPFKYLNKHEKTLENCFVCSK